VIDGEAQAAKIARFMAAVSLISALAIAFGFETNYLRFHQWLAGAYADLTSAAAYDAPDGGELSLVVTFTAPPVGFHTEVKSMEFALQGPEGHFGYYRTVLPEGVSPSAQDSGSIQLSLVSNIPPKHWPKLRSSSAPQLDGRLIVYLHLPGREVPARVPISGLISLEEI